MQRSKGTSTSVSDGSSGTVLKGGGAPVGCGKGANTSDRCKRVPRGVLVLEIGDG